MRIPTSTAHIGVPTTRYAGDVPLRVVTLNVGTLGAPKQQVQSLDHVLDALLPQDRSARVGSQNQAVTEVNAPARTARLHQVIQDVPASGPLPWLVGGTAAVAPGLPHALRQAMFMGLGMVLAPRLIPAVPLVALGAASYPRKIGDASLAYMPMPPEGKHVEGFRPLDANDPDLYGPPSSEVTHPSGPEAWELPITDTATPQWLEGGPRVEAPTVPGQAQHQSDWSDLILEARRAETSKPHKPKKMDTKALDTKALDQEIRALIGDASQVGRLDIKRVAERKRQIADAIEPKLKAAGLAVDRIETAHGPALQVVGGEGHFGRVAGWMHREGADHPAVVVDPLGALLLGAGGGSVYDARSNGIAVGVVSLIHALNGNPSDVLHEARHGLTERARRNGDTTYPYYSWYEWGDSIRYDNAPYKGNFRVDEVRTFLTQARGELNGLRRDVARLSQRDGADAREQQARLVARGQEALMWTNHVAGFASVAADLNTRAIEALERTPIERKSDGTFFGADAQGHPPYVQYPLYTPGRFFGQNQVGWVDYVSSDKRGNVKAYVVMFDKPGKEETMRLSR